MSRDEWVQTVLRLDGMVVVINPTPDGSYELVIEQADLKLVRPISSDVALNPLAAPEFDAVVRELKSELSQPAHEATSR
jgi:hypothetical protein